MATSLSAVRRVTIAAMTVAMASVAFSGCTLTSDKASASSAEQRMEINSSTDAVLTRLYETSPESRQLVQNAKGVLVFPSVLSAGFIVGGQYGKGVLRVNGKDAGYYSTTAGSIGFQAGAQSKAIILLFMTDDALTKFQNSNGWTVGADATVAIANVGANGSLSTNTAQQPIVGFVMNNGGLMAGVSLEGAKITKLGL